MNRRKSNKSPSKNSDNVVPKDMRQQSDGVVEDRRVLEDRRTTFERREEAYQGPVPPPAILERFDLLVPGTAKKMFDLAEEESLHRRSIEERTNDANISAQQIALQIERDKAAAIARSDLVGQIAGVIVALSCIGGAIWLAMQNHEKIAAALCVIPSAAVIQAFFAKRSGQKQPQQ